MRYLLPVLLALPALAHLNSFDTYSDGNAGPYALSITIRNPDVIPGVAGIEVRTPPGVKSMEAAPVPIAGIGSQFFPAPDVMRQSASDPQFFTGNVWIMVPGGWRIRLTMDGDKGKGEYSIPIAAAAKRTLPMTVGLGVALSILGLILCAGFVSIVGASIRESSVEPGMSPSRLRGAQARIGMAVAAVFVGGALFGGNYWWGKEAEGFKKAVFKPSGIKVTQPEKGRLLLALESGGWYLRTDDLIADHGHFMHAFIVSLDLDKFWHLHPASPLRGIFTKDLPPMPDGKYQIFGDIVHNFGFPETVTAQADLTGGVQELSGDDSYAEKRPGATDTMTPFDGGYRIVWVNPKPAKTKQPVRFDFRVEDSSGNPATDLELYMGMQGHAAFIKKDRTVFAHVHPSGNIPMATLDLVNAKTGGAHEGHTGSGIPATVSFPFGIPQAGGYRVFVQVKRAGKVQTGIFDFTAVD